MIKNCPICKKQFKTYRSKRIYCSRECACKGNRVNGDVVSNLGIKIKVGNKYSAIQFRKREIQKAITRNFKKDLCELCGRKDGELFLHHIVPLRLGGRSIKKNCITVCRKCHSKVRTKLSSKMLEYFEDKQDELYEELKDTVVDIFWLSFIEEGIFNPKYEGYVGGRVEVYSKGSNYAIEEIRFFTNKKSWNSFRDKWDFKEVTKKELDKIRSLVEERFNVPLE